MKLYLSSYKFGDNPKALSDLFGENKRVALISNAKDYITDKQDLKESENKQLEGLKAIDLIPEVLDLKEYFNKTEKLREKLEEFGGVWVRGGNTFVLRMAYKLSGFDVIIHENVKDKNFVYAGYSAGACVLQTSLKGIDFVDDPSKVKSTYGQETMWEGVGLFDYAFVPHFESDHSESADTNEEVEYYKKNNIAYRTLRDGEVIIEELN